MNLAQSIQTERITIESRSRGVFLIEFAMGGFTMEWEGVSDLGTSLIGRDIHRSCRTSSELEGDGPRIEYFLDSFGPGGMARSMADGEDSFEAGDRKQPSVR